MVKCYDFNLSINYLVKRLILFLAKNEVRIEPSAQTPAVENLNSEIHSVQTQQKGRRR